MFLVDSSMCIFWALSGVDTQEGGAPEVQCHCATIVRHRLDTELVMCVQARNETGVQAQCLSIMLFRAWPRNRVPRACSSFSTLPTAMGPPKRTGWTQENSNLHPWPTSCLLSTIRQGLGLLQGRSQHSGSRHCLPSLVHTTHNPHGVIPTAR